MENQNEKEIKMNSKTIDTIHGIDPQNEFDILKIKLSAAI